MYLIVFAMCYHSPHSQRISNIKEEIRKKFLSKNFLHENWWLSFACEFSQEMIKSHALTIACLILVSDGSMR